MTMNVLAPGKWACIQFDSAIKIGCRTEWRVLAGWVRLVHEIEAKQFRIEDERDVRIADKRLDSCGKSGINPIAQADPHKSHDASRQGVERADIADVCQVKTVCAGQIAAIRGEITIGGIVEVCDGTNGSSVLGAEHCAVLPPWLPAQLHDHGPVPPTEDAVPMRQRSVVGAALTAMPLEEPHAPFKGAICVTLIENAASAAVALPLLTLIMMFE